MLIAWEGDRSLLRIKSQMKAISVICSQIIDLFFSYSINLSQDNVNEELFMNNEGKDLRLLKAQRSSKRI